jgi:hypothetical protein
MTLARSTPRSVHLILFYLRRAVTPSEDWSFRSRFRLGVLSAVAGLLAALSLGCRIIFSSRRRAPRAGNRRRRVREDGTSARTSGRGEG